jgi:hypothetical protein
MAANCAGLCARVCGRVDWAHGDGCGRAGLPTLSTCPSPHVDSCTATASLGECCDQIQLPQLRPTYSIQLLPRCLIFASHVVSFLHSRQPTRPHQPRWQRRCVLSRRGPRGLGACVGTGTSRRAFRAAHLRASAPPAPSHPLLRRFGSRASTCRAGSSQASKCAPLASS